MNYKAMLSFIIVVGFFIFLIFAYIRYSNKAWEHESIELKQSVINAIKNDHDLIQKVTNTSSADAVVKGADLSTQEGKIIALMRENLQKDPQFLVNILENYYANRAQIDREAKAKKINLYRQQLEANPQDPYAGSKTAKFKIIEFFDYSCLHCKKMETVKKQVLKKYPNVAFVFKEVPIINAASILSSKFALAVNMIDPERYMLFQSKVFSYGGVKNEENLLLVAKQVGVNTFALRKVLQDREGIINQQLEDNLKLATNLGIQGTPTYILNNQLLAGSTSEADFDKWVEDAMDDRNIDKPGNDTNPSGNADQNPDNNTMTPEEQINNRTAGQVKVNSTQNIPLNVPQEQGNQVGNVAAAMPDKKLELAPEPSLGLPAIPNN